MLIGLRISLVKLRFYGQFAGESFIVPYKYWNDDAHMARRTKQVSESDCLNTRVCAITCANPPSMMPCHVLFAWKVSLS